MKWRRAGVALGSSALVFAGCVGLIGDGEGTNGDNGPPAPGTFACNPGDPSATVLPRLSHEQYMAALETFVADAVGGDAAPVMDAVQTSLTLVPTDTNEDHDRLDQNITQAHVDGQYYAAVAVARQLTGASRIDTVVGSCATDADASNDDACIDEFVRRLGYRAHRMPLSSAEVDFYRNDVFEPADGMDPRAFADVITVMLLSPRFVYRVETEGAPVEDRDDLFRLSGHELAARLALQFWNAPPDDALYAAAESGELETEEGYAVQIDRVLNDPRAQATIDRFYSEWLWLDDLAPLDTPELRQNVLDETLELARYYTWDTDGTLADLFTSDRSFAKTADVADVYGVDVYTEGSEPPQLNGRSGILTRAAMLATGSNSTHPILRGREIRRRILCGQIPPPPPDAMDMAPDVDPLATTRERVEEMTEQPGSNCIGCHSSINPLGYPFENFDGEGRLRTEETIYDNDGNVLDAKPVDTESVPRIAPDDDRTVANGVELSELIAESDFAHACFSRHFFRFAFHRQEDDDVDGCVLEDFRSHLVEGGSIKDALRQIAMSDTFRMKKLAN